MEKAVNVKAFGSSELASAPPTPVRAVVLAATNNGLVIVESPYGTWECEILQQVAFAPTWRAGDRVLVLPPGDEQFGVILGRVGRAGAPDPIHIEVASQLTLTCGQSSLEMRADGKVLIRGEDVLVRAKGTKRIRAGTVSIN